VRSRAYSSGLKVNPAGSKPSVARGRLLLPALAVEVVLIVVGHAHLDDVLDPLLSVRENVRALGRIDFFGEERFECSNEDAVELRQTTHEQPGKRACDNQLDRLMRQFDGARIVAGDPFTRLAQPFRSIA
jgi:hypothetical protein